MPNSRESTVGPAAVLGGGPAGITAGYLLAKQSRPSVLFEADDVVGGLARTVVREGYRFDLGGHRFFTKSHEVEALWREVLGDELLTRPRLSRIRWRGRFIDYPLQAGDVVRKLGPLELARCSGSYAVASLRRRREAESFEDWVIARFGRRLFELFFRTYTEKVWGVPTGELRAEWAAQRIRDLSFGRAARAAMLGDGGGVRSLIEEFRYPRLGPGQMWDTMLAELVRMGGEARLGTPVTRLTHAGGRITSVETADGAALEPGPVISSLPLGAVAEMLDPAPPSHVLQAARGLRYRDFLTVALVIRGEDPFPDTWIYVHDPEVRVGRIQNFRAWSPWMVPHQERSCLGLEYFCFEGDELWSSPDEALIERATAELVRIGLAAADQVERGWVVRVPKAYPIYDSQYGSRVAAIRSWLERLGNLQQVGRNGLHRYNNSDHSMLTAIRAVENASTGTSHDIWAVNTDSVYHEEDVADEHPYREAPSTPASAQGAAAGG
jgi:protoporphyrinogen oxidase